MAKFKFCPLVQKAYLIKHLLAEKANNSQLQGLFFWLNHFLSFINLFALNNHHHILMVTVSDYVLLWTLWFRATVFNFLGVWHSAFNVWQCFLAFNSVYLYHIFSTLKRTLKNELVMPNYAWISILVKNMMKFDLNRLKLGFYEL